MYGPNMAIRKTAWEAIRADTETRSGVIDDLDLALCLLNKGMRIEQLLHLHATTSARRRRTSPAKLWQLQQAGIRTLTDQGHRLLPALRVWIACSMIGHTMQWPIYRFWDFERGRFSLRPGAERMFPLTD